jgi:hypothetical protein
VLDWISFPNLASYYNRGGEADSDKPSEVKQTEVVVEHGPRRSCSLSISRVCRGRWLDELRNEHHFADTAHLGGSVRTASQLVDEIALHVLPPQGVPVLAGAPSE